MNLKLVGLFAFIFIIVTACKGEVMSDGYNSGDITIQGVEKSDDGSTKVFYASILETLYFCPGANVTETKDQIHIEFIRCSIKDKCEVTHPAMQGQDDYILIDKGEKRLFIKCENELVGIRSRKI